MTNNGRKLMENGFYYYVIFDIINRIPVATYLTDSVTNKKIKDFINKSIPPKDRVAIITDLKPGYDKIMERIKICSPTL